MQLKLKKNNENQSNSHFKNGVLDPQGKAIQQTLNGMSFSNVEEVRQGKFFEISVKKMMKQKPRHKLKKCVKNF